ncbi:MAG: efflux RND transporter periplasmic adaptor subunit [Sedimentisphaerales bacterium]|nr:efflux RND transporter periplasmic adaptor subunit [Sedimentisphaerales bacterium]
MKHTNDKMLSRTVKNKALFIVAMLFLGLGIFVGRMSYSGILHETDSPTQEVVHAGEKEQAGHEGHEHQAAEEIAPDDLEKAVCEHAMRIIDCDECRYEVGVVKIDPSIAASLIQTGMLADMERTRMLTFTGQVELDRTKAVDVVSTGGGRVEQVKKLIGEKVAKGDILAVLHSADLGQAKADFLEVQAKLELTQAAFRREQGLYEKKITSQADYQNALNELKAAQASYAATDKRLRLFGLETEQIAGIKNEKENGNFADLTLRAPQSGTIITQTISVGTIVDATESLYAIADLSHLWVWCDVYEKDLAILQEQFAQEKSLPAMVRVKAFEPIAFPGEVDLVGHLMDEHTRTVKMRVQVKNPEGKLRPGMFADVRVAIPLPGQMMAVPQVAVMSDGGKDFIFQQWENDLWIRRDVSVGDKCGQFIEILSGIPRGATIVTGGAFMLKSDILREKMGAGCAD